MSGKVAAGAVTILWGARAGLGAKATRIPVTANAYYGFGAALATGDFNGDGKPDLAVADGVGTTYIYRGGIGPAGTTGRVTSTTTGTSAKPPRSSPDGSRRTTPQICTSSARGTGATAG